MAILTVRHVTTYSYASPMRLGEHRMMLRPRDSNDQRNAHCVGSASLNAPARVPMLIEAGFDIAFGCPAPTPMILQLRIHPSRDADLLTPDRIVSGPPSGSRRRRNREICSMSASASLPARKNSVTLSPLPFGPRSGELLRVEGTRHGQQEADWRQFGRQILPTRAFDGRPKKGSSRHAEERGRAHPSEVV